MDAAFEDLEGARARLASLASLGLVVAWTFVPPCFCGASDAAAAPVGCHDTGAGFAEARMDCGCACLSAVPAPAAERTQVPVIAATSAHASAPTTSLDHGVVLTASAPALATLLHSPPRHQILRV